MATLGPTPAPLPAWIVFRYDLQKMSWEEVGVTHSGTAGDAFRELVLPPAYAAELPKAGEYRIFPLEGSAHLAVEFNLRDLDAPDERRTAASA